MHTTAGTLTEKEREPVEGLVSGRLQRVKKPSGKETQILRWEEIAMKGTRLSFEGEDSTKVTSGSLRPWSGHAEALDPARATPHPHPQCTRGNQASELRGSY